MFSGVSDILKMCFEVGQLLWVKLPFADGGQPEYKRPFLIIGVEKSFVALPGGVSLFILGTSPDIIVEYRITYSIRDKISFPVDRAGIY